MHTLGPSSRNLTILLEPESAASQALRIPHIVSAVLSYVRCYHPPVKHHTLKNCSLVNSLWAEEANKLLWKNCDGMFYTPMLENLANIRMDRRQKYANYIRRLTIRQYSHANEEKLWIGSSLPKVSHLSFPRLKELSIGPFSRGGTCYEPLPINQFVQPRLRILRLYVSQHNRFVISQEFLQELQQKSPRLEHIKILQDRLAPLDSKWDILPDQAACFWQTFKLLESVRWSLNGSMSKVSFKALSLCPKLRSIDFRSIHESWVEDLSETAFSVLEKLRCTGSVSALKALAPHIKSITHLHLSDVKQSIGIWDFVVKAQFRFLKSLELCLQSSTVIRGSEILSIACCSPQLQELQVWTDRRANQRIALIAEEFSDETIKELSKYLPMLTYLDLRCYSRTINLSESSLISLGRCCPLLEHFRIFAIINWEELIKEALAPLWPRLESFYIDHHLSDADINDEVDEYNDTEELGRALAQHLPAVTTEKYCVSLGRGKKAHRLLEVLLQNLEERCRTEAIDRSRTTLDSSGEPQETV